MATLAIVRSYEVVSTFLFLVSSHLVVRSKNPLYVGIWLASSIGGAIFEWVFDSKYYFRITFDDRFIPAWTLGGEKAPLAMILFYGLFFGAPFILLQKYRQSLQNGLGTFGTYTFVILLALVGTPAFECANTTMAEIYKYNQKEEYLMFGMPWSNLWFGALMMVLPHMALEKARVLILLLPRTSLSPKDQWLLACLGAFGAVITGFFIASTINGVWYVWAGDIWVDSARAF